MWVHDIAGMLLFRLLSVMLLSPPQLVHGGVDYEYLKERHKAHTDSLREIQSYLK